MGRYRKLLKLVDPGISAFIDIQNEQVLPYTHFIKKKKSDFPKILESSALPKPNFVESRMTFNFTRKQENHFPYLQLDNQSKNFSSLKIKQADLDKRGKPSTISNMDSWKVPGLFTEELANTRDNMSLMTSPKDARERRMNKSHKLSKSKRPTSVSSIKTKVYKVQLLLILGTVRGDTDERIESNNSTANRKCHS